MVDRPVPHDPARPEVEAAVAARWMREGRARLIDVREPDEHARERIEGAALHPLSRFDPHALPAGDEEVLVVHCKSGRRSAEARARLEAAGCGRVCSLKGGIDAWRQAGLPTVVDRRAPISLTRQVQVIAGGTVLVGSVLAWLVSPLFWVVPAFFGAGLLFSGASGTCAMAALLALMPWNRAFRNA